MATMTLASGHTAWQPRAGWVPKVVAVDEDGTFLSTSAGYDVERFEAVWPHLAAAGTRFVVASGNQYWQIRDFFPAHVDEIAYVSANGSHVVDVGSVPVFAAAADAAAVAAVIAEAHRAPELSLLMSGVRGAYVERDAPEDFVATMSQFFHRIAVVDDLSQVDDQVYMFSSFAADGTSRAWMERYERVCAGTLVPVYSGDGYFDLVVAGVNKARGLRLLCERWGVDAADVAAFGDSDNDLEMLAWAGAGYAMANAAPHVRAAANGVAPANTDDGVLQLLEAWFAHPSGGERHGA